ncbi:MAG: DUF3160 domain-containing protein [Clostridiales bacterium]|nr:DUF3160 domain-containing protein [Clostridiales bacterium]
MKKKLKTFLAVSLIVSIVCACTAPQASEGNTDNTSTENVANTTTENQAANESNETDTSTDTSATSQNGAPEGVTQTFSEPFANGRPLLIKQTAADFDIGITPCVAPYTVEPDLSNVDNLYQFHYFADADEFIEKLADNGFIVYGNSGCEFHEVYEMNRYEYIPNFVTVDSLMHAYHLYFSYLLKNIEREYLSENLTRLSTLMLEESMAQYELLKGSEWEGAAQINVAFFTIGAKLLDESVTPADYVESIVTSELDKINAAEGIGTSLITNDYEDYSQYKPRGYYENDETLEKYFKTMMWYGRIHFRQDNADMDRSALLMTKAFADNPEAYSLWEGIYAVTSFFAGASDDLGAYEYSQAMTEAYGDDFTIAELKGDSEAFNVFHNLTGTLPAPQINSIPIEDGEGNTILGFRFMGQRFTIDAAIMQKLIYSNVGANSSGAKRMLPDVLDVPAALGSDIALDILQEQGDTDYENYSENMAKLQSSLLAADDTLWSASLYAGWLNTLRPLLSPKGEGYPAFMQSDEWLKKDLECFAGSFAELKHDTILYSKQVIAEMGGGEIEYDDRGYVEPEPLVYARFNDLANMTLQGLKEYGMLTEKDEENLSRLSQMSEQLLTISNKELMDEVLTDEEYEFIRCYGGSIEHFWIEVAADTSGEDYVATQEFPAAVVADIATNPDDATVLEVGTANPSYILVLVNVDGKIKLARGSVYNFYQFEWPLQDRLTDSKWHYMLGIKADENGERNYEPLPIEKPEWTMGYRDE